METIYLAAGCFWGTDAIFRSLQGVVSVVPGYMGGHVDNPTYEQVSRGDTGHAEAVKIEYNPNIIPTENLLRVFFNTHDPTSLDKQGSDVGSQYRSVIFYTEHEQKEIAEKIIKELSKNLSGDKKIVTQLILFPDFHPAEDHHRDYYRFNKDNTYCQLVIEPKLKKLKEHHQDLLKYK